MATEPTVTIRSCPACNGEGHIDFAQCSICEGYGQIDSEGVKHISLQRLHAGLAAWAASQGWPYGVPIPSIGPSTNRLVIAKRAPFGDREVPIMSMPEMLGHVAPRELREKDDKKFINCWFDRNGDSVYIFEDPDGKRRAYVGRGHFRTRFNMIIETMAARQGAVSARAEMKAFISLADRLNETQSDSYLVNGCFLETSKRSGVTYLFRKGLPTLALRSRDGHVKLLAALCLHPLAYYEYTHAGSMAPSDEILAHLLMMRADEHRLWKESNQHPMWASQSGI